MHLNKEKKVKKASSILKVNRNRNKLQKVQMLKMVKIKLKEKKELMVKKWRLSKVKKVIEGICRDRVRERISIGLILIKSLTEICGIVMLMRSLEEWKCRWRRLEEDFGDCSGMNMYKRNEWIYILYKIN